MITTDCPRGSPDALIIKASYWVRSGRRHEMLVLLTVRESIEGTPVSLERAASVPLLFTVLASKFLIDLVAYYINGLEQPLQELLFPD
ncbi:hypothetical protein [Haloarcula sp. Atlit-7R]|uniref:hypothetical protein n=1 Tax=Haloarcula sp. Atlit-7R TaxID=2282125 RepID=UPI0011C4352D|nr:hypothetical protein [Haloarcula sp. Atlit-7R]